MRRAVVFVLIGVLGGCTDHLAARQAYLNQFIGRPEADLVLQMGVPTRTYETGGVKYLAYTDSRVDIAPGFPAYGFGAPYWGWYGGGFPPQVVNLTCETTFAVSDAIVRTATMRGNACG